MSDLKLESLRIQNFRTFKDLTIDRLGRVNLIVGKNNVGKTSLLEALNLYSRGGTGVSLSDIVASRELDLFDEYRSTEKSDFGVDLPTERHLFYGRPDLSDLAPDDKELEVPPIRIDSTPEENDSLTVELHFSPDDRRVSTSVRAGEVGGVSTRIFRGKTLSVFLTAREIRAEAEEYWDRIALTDDEVRVVRALQIIDENVEDVGLATSRSKNSQHEYDQFPISRLKGADRPEPLGNLGEGMNRAFALAVGLVRATDGILLVDEIENGIHYSVQPELWRMIFETAQELNVQVFATTHSHDCVRAFQEVSSEHEEEGMLISLRRKRSDSEHIVAVPIEEDELEYAVESHTDVR